ncbi:MAG: tRNA (adenosine(37)-N6)-threonylcarbamoyltransferase complex transferase subunit TsaD [Planctomycetota bacterium]
MRLLTIESTCDETAAAIVTDQLQVLGACVASQESLHERYQGVVPEIAARAHVECMLPVIEQTLRRAGLGLHELDAIAVANEPGLSGSLLVGVCAAKALAVATGLPLIAVDHLHAHIYACQVATQRDVFPCVGLVVSGGHTHLFRCESATRFEPLGGTIDDAAGEAFDKVASMLGLGYPGGPAISAAARRGNPQAYPFPRAFLRDPTRLQFSFSGLKTAVRYAITGKDQVVDPKSISLTGKQIADLAASFEEAVVDCLVAKSLQALEQTGLSRLCVGGGVAANARLRARLADEIKAREAELMVAPLELCTDNAVMGAVAIEKLKAGEIACLDLDILPGLRR